MQDWVEQLVLKTKHKKLRPWVLDKQLPVSARCKVNATKTQISQWQKHAGETRLSVQKRVSMPLNAANIGEYISTTK